MKVEKIETNPNDPEMSSMSPPSTESDTNVTIDGSNSDSNGETIVSFSKAGRPKGNMNQKMREDIKK